MSKISICLITIICAGLITGCGSTASVVQPYAIELIGDVRYEVSDIEVEADNVPEHFVAAIRGHLRAELLKQTMLADQHVEGTHILSIVITEYRMRSGITRAMWGVFAGKDGVDGIVTVLDASSGEAVGKFHVKSYNVMAVGNEDDVARMFAREVAKSITKT